MFWLPSIGVQSISSRTAFPTLPEGPPIVKVAAGPTVVEGNGMIVAETGDLCLTAPDPPELKRNRLAAAVGGWEG